MLVFTWPSDNIIENNARQRQLQGLPLASSRMKNAAAKPTVANEEALKYNRLATVYHEDIVTHQATHGTAKAQPLTVMIANGT